MQRLNRERRRVMFSRRQAANGIEHVDLRHLSRFADGFSRYQLSQHRSAHECRRTSIREIPRRLDAIVFDDQRQSQPIAANRILLIRNSIGIRKLTGIPWMREVIFELGGVRQDLL